MGVFSHIFTLCLVAFAANQVYNFSKLWFPDHCSAEYELHHPSSCIAPVFDVTRRVNMYVYTAPNAAWASRWSRALAVPSSHTPFHVVYNVSLMHAWSEHMQVPLYKSTRRNGTIAVMFAVGEATAPPPSSSSQRRRRDNTADTDDNTDADSSSSAAVDAHDDASASAIASTTSTAVKLASPRYVLMATSVSLVKHQPVTHKEKSFLMSSSSSSPSAAAAADDDDADAADTVVTSNSTAVAKQSDEYDPNNVDGDAAYFAGAAPIAHWKPQVKLRLVLEQRSFRYDQIPRDIRWDVRRLDRESAHMSTMRRRRTAAKAVMATSTDVVTVDDDDDGVRMRDVSAYYPHFHVDELHQFAHHLVPLSRNTSRADPYITLNYAPVSLGTHRLFSQLGAAIGLMHNMGMTETETNEVLQLFNPDRLYYLALTYVVAMLHTLFSFLAFKNDIGFWKSRESMAGMSRRAVTGNAICSLIIFLFLLDSPGVSWMIVGSSGMSSAVDAWKVLRVWQVSRSQAAAAAAAAAATTSKSVSIERDDTNHDNDDDDDDDNKGNHNTRQHGDAGDAADVDNLVATIETTAAITDRETEEYDARAFTYLLYLLYPLVTCHGIYSLFYEPHRSWWSWFIRSASNGVYMFGFVMMTPQLFINYKLKSVAHLPWRALTYKIFNTFVDDVFAFVIEMPTIHRLATLRDDIVFFVYLYQWYLYPVDKKRVNEFGKAYQREEEEEQQQQQQQEEQVVVADKATGVSAVEQVVDNDNDNGAASEVNANGDVDGLRRRTVRQK